MKNYFNLNKKDHFSQIWKNLNKPVKNWWKFPNLTGDQFEKLKITSKSDFDKIF